MEEPFGKAKPIIEKLIAAGFEAYFVGGSVRDVLLGRSLGDIDIATSALPEDVERLFQRTIPVGIEHGTVVVLLDDNCYEVTTFRIDGDYVDFRHPSKVEFVSSLTQDLSRRDFTMNAIAMDSNGVIIDPFNGKKDLDSRFIQTVGNPDDRFLEDPLRMMRAIRFVSQLDFTLSEETKQSIKKHGCYLKKISVERILVEFEKLLVGKANKKSLVHIVELGLYRFLPEIHNKKKELLQFAEFCSELLQIVDEQWALFVKVLNVENIEQFFKKWKCSNNRIKVCKLYLYALEELQSTQVLSPFIVYTYGADVMKTVIKLHSILHQQPLQELERQLNEITETLPILSRKELTVTGNDLMVWFNKKGGPWLSHTIDLVEKAVVCGEVLNDKAEIKEWLHTCNPQSENNY